MQSKSTTSEEVKDAASYVMILLSSFGLGLSVERYFISDKPALSSLLPLFIVPTSVLVKTFCHSSRQKIINKI
jgi:hypothetical protein